MADETVVHIGENSPEHVAFQLTDRILLNIQKKLLTDLDQKTYLDTYAECLNAVRGRRLWKHDK